MVDGRTGIHLARQARTQRTSEASVPTVALGTPGPLSGLRVVELGEEQSAYCGLVLAGLGAEVVKVEPPTGCPSRLIGPFYGDQPDPERSLFFWTYNRGKRSVVIDLEHEGDADAFEALLGGADVLLDSVPRAYLTEISRETERVAARHPRLIHARMSPFGDSGPWRDFKGSDLVHLALGGVMMNCGYDPDPFGHHDLPPIAPQVWHAFHIAGEQLAMGIVAALLARSGSGEGQYISCAIHEAVAKNTEMDLMSWVMIRQPFTRQTCRHAMVNVAPSTISYTKDGRWLNTIGVGARDHRLLKPFLDRYGLGDGLEEDTRPDEVGVRGIPGSQAGAVTDAAFIQRWASRFSLENAPWKDAQESGLLWSPIRKPHENTTDEHWLARGTFSDLEHPEVDRTFRYPTSKWLSTRGSWSAGRRAPQLDEDRDALWGAGPAIPKRVARDRITVPIRSPHGTPFPIQGVRILDFGWFLASAGATRYLAALGADVLKVEWKENPDSGRGSLVPEGGIAARRHATEPMRSLSDPEIGGQFNNKNAGKRGISLNVRHPKGLEIAKALVAKCDVVTEGFSPGVLERFGLGYDVLTSINPEIIYVKQSGMGAFGTYGKFRAVGPIAAALSGMSEMSGLPEPAPPAGWGYSYLDWFGAYSMALSVLSALYHREQTGEGQWIDASQTEVGIFLTGVPILDWSANGRPWERYGNRSPYKVAAPQGVYRCRGDDRWLAISCFTDTDWESLARAMQQPEWLADERFGSIQARMRHHDILDGLIESHARDRDPYELMHDLQAAGVAAGVCQTAEDRCDNDPQLQELGWLTEVTAAKIGTWPVAEMPVKMSATPPHAGGPFRRGAPLYGEHNRDVLGELLGLSADEVDALAEEGVL